MKGTMTSQEITEQIAGLLEHARMVSEQMKETGRQMKETERRMEETDRRMKKLQQMYGGISNSFGESAERFFYYALEEHPYLGDVRFDDVANNMKSRIGKLQGEYDIVLLNGDSVGIVEVKNKIHLEDITKIVEKMIPKFKTLFPTYRDHNIYAAVAGMAVGEDVRKLAEKHGLFVLTQSGQESRLLNSPEFQATVF